MDLKSFPQSNNAHYVGGHFIDLMVHGVYLGARPKSPLYGEDNRDNGMLQVGKIAAIKAAKVLLTVWQEREVMCAGDGRSKVVLIELGK